MALTSQPIKTGIEPSRIQHWSLLWKLHVSMLWIYVDLFNAKCREFVTGTMVNRQWIQRGETRSWTNWRIAGLPSKCCWRRLAPGWLSCHFFWGWWLKQHRRGRSFDQLTKLKKKPKDPRMKSPNIFCGCPFFLQQAPKGSHSNLPWFQDWEKKQPIFLFLEEANQDWNTTSVEAFPTCEAMVLTAISLNYWLILFAWAGWIGWSAWWCILPATRMGWASAID